MAMAAKAQKKDTSAFYMNNNGRMAESKEAADFVRVLLPADNSVDKDLIPVNDVFKDGKRKLIAFTYINSPYIENGLHGAYIEYFHNGHRKYIRTYNNGTLTGECLSYYPNGKLYSVINYTSDGPRLLQCSDSTGKVVANGGNGNWIKTNADFEYLAQGPVKDGREDGEWEGTVDNGKTEKAVYQNGKLISGRDFDKAIVDIYTAVDVQPQFPGGDMEFSRFLARNVRYPSSAYKNNVQGRVILTFVVEKDGTISNIKVLRGVGSGIDEEAIRVIRSSPPWKPGMQKGKPVRVQYSVPMQFSLSGN
jgi:TonB family protein